MFIELAKLRNGSIAFLTDDPLPSKVKAFEYFSGQHYLGISYENDDIDDFLYDHELSDETITAIESADDKALIIEMSGESPQGYYVPLIRISE